MDVDAVCRAVAEAFADTGVGTRSWPDPHPDGPAEEEYSRCADTAKYRIVGARVDAWLRALTALGLATVSAVEDPAAAWRERPPHRDPATPRAHWVRPRRPGALPLLVCLRGVAGVPDTVAALGAGVPAVEVATVPVCGCDACDHGSAELLHELDGHVLDVISGAFVHVATPRGVARGGRTGWSANGFREGDAVAELLAQARAGRSPHTVVHGACWW